MTSRSDLELMIITNDPSEAKKWELSGVDLIFIDLEVNGKAERQKGRDAVKSNHSVADVSAVKDVLSTSKVLVRINPFHSGTQKEVNDAIARGADVLMLPMFHNAEQIELFRDMIAGRAEIYPLIETVSALKSAQILSDVSGIDGYHFGLNDLHIEFKLNFMFEVFFEEEFLGALQVFNNRGIKFGIGGVSALGHGLLPAELILNEHARVGSGRVILSRAFKTIVNGDIQVAALEVTKLKDYYRDAAMRRQNKVQDEFTSTIKMLAKQAAKND